MATTGRRRAELRLARPVFPVSPHPLGCLGLAGFISSPPASPLHLFCPFTPILILVTSSG